MQKIIKEEIKEVMKLKKECLKTLPPILENIAKEIISALKKGGKILLLGNGGSAADAQHIAAELVGKFQKERKTLPAIALNTNTSIITAISNDYDFKYIFSRQIESIANSQDILIAISTSGNSPNVLEAVRVAKKMGIKTIGMTGARLSKLEKLADITLKVPSTVTPRIQEVHITCGHILCKLIEDYL